MGWLFELHKTQPMAHAIGVLTLVCVLGMALGSVKFRGIAIRGAVSAPLIGWLAGFDAAAALGIFSGASTNTPSLGAGTQTLSTLPGIAPYRLTPRSDVVR
jgi:uncharacterized transporter YbjL